MKSLALSLLLVCSVLAMSCGKSGTPGNKRVGDGGSAGICPNNPSQCDGTCCGTDCFDTMSDPHNCGACGNACQNGQLCQGGHCGCPPSNIACGTGQVCCGSSGCKSLESDVNNCGGCGVTCGTGATCSNGQCLCGVSACATGQQCCSGVCQDSCAVDMSAPPDMSTIPTTLCTCADHCANDALPVCVGTDCCLGAALLSLCASTPNTCLTNPLP